MAKRNSEVENDLGIVDETKPIETTEKERVVETIVESIVIDDNKVYKAEVIQNFGKTLKGSIIEKKGSIIKILVSQKLVKII